MTVIFTAPGLSDYHRSQRLHVFTDLTYTAVIHCDNLIHTVGNAA